jgi:hypothetical protein
VVERLVNCTRASDMANRPITIGTSGMPWISQLWPKL